MLCAIREVGPFPFQRAHAARAARELPNLVDGRGEVSWVLLFLLPYQAKEQRKPANF